MLILNTSSCDFSSTEKMHLSWPQETAALKKIKIKIETLEFPELQEMNRAMLFGGGSRINTKNYGLYINVWSGRLCHFLDHIRWCNLLVGDDHITLIVTKIFLLTMNFLVAVESAINPRHLCHGMAFALAHYVGRVTVPIAFPKGFHHSMVHNDRGWSVWLGGGGGGLQP